MQRSRLSGWKSIGRHLDRDARTAQRWEAKRGLPVHRVPGGAGHAVFAYAHELDTWLAGASTQAEQQASAASSAPSAPAGAAAAPAAAAPDARVEWAPGLLVVPFDFLAPEAGLAFTADALTEELIGRLGAADLASMRVLSWTTSKTFRQAPMRAPAIRSDLGVRYLIEGAVKAAGDRWRVDVRVVDAERDAVLFTDRFACRAREALVMQAEIAEAVSAHLSLHLAGDPWECEWSREVDPAALLDHFRGVRLLRSGTLADISQALACAEQAIRIDRGYAPAHALCGTVMLSLARFQMDRTLTARARGHAAECQQAAPQLAMTSLLAASLAALDFDWELAEALLDGSIRAAPSRVQARGRLSNVLTLQRRFAEAGALLDSIGGLEASEDLGRWQATRYLWERDFERSRKHFDAVIDACPHDLYAHVMRFMSAIYARDVAGARNLLASMSPAASERYGVFLQGMLAARSNDASTARARCGTLRAAARDGQLPWYLTAMISGVLGEPREAVASLAHAVDAGEPQSGIASVDPSFDAVRGDAEFSALMRRMRLPE